MRPAAAFPPAATSAALRSGALPLANHVDAILERVDRAEPELQALLPEPGRAARLHRAAKELAETWPDPTGRPPLFGLAVAVKDNIRVDGLPTRAGSRLPPETFAGPEATVITRLRAQGALILGKAVTTEFTLGQPGPTRNPRDTAHTPGGSSSGSAAAVAADYCPIALGTQTGGSVIRPAAYCGIVGFKPGFGRIAVAGIVPYAPSLDHVGIFTADVAAADAVAAWLCDGWDALRVQAAQRRLPLLGITSGALMDPVEPAARQAFEAVLARLGARGYALREVDLPAGLDTLRAERRDLALGELAQVHGDWFARHEALYSDYTAIRIQMGQDIPPRRVAQLRAGLPERRRIADADLARAGVDLLLSPAAPGPAPAGIASTGSSIMNQPFTYTGQPTLSLPCGFLPGGHLPLGLQIVAPKGGDEALLGWAADIETALAAA